MVKNLNKKAELFRQKSEIYQQENRGPGQNEKHFSLVMSKEWEASGSQQFVDLHHLVLNGIPPVFRSCIWADLMKTSIIQIDEQRSM